MIAFKEKKTFQCPWDNFEQFLDTWLNESEANLSLHILIRQARYTTKIHLSGMGRQTCR